MKCFFCEAELPNSNRVIEQVHGKEYTFHSSCAHEIIKTHIILTLQREADIDKAAVLADRLKFEKEVK